MKIRTRKYKFIILTNYRPEIIEWKKQSSKLEKTLDLPHYDFIITLLRKFFGGFDLITVPAPTFHTYNKNYPIYEVAKILAGDLGMGFKILFPNKSGRKNKGWFEARNKPVQRITEDIGGLKILVIDDIYTTGNTLRVTCEAIFNANASACGVALC